MSKIFWIFCFFAKEKLVKTKAVLQKHCSTQKGVLQWYCSTLKECYNEIVALVCISQVFLVLVTNFRGNCSTNRYEVNFRISYSNERCKMTSISLLFILKNSWRKAVIFWFLHLLHLIIKINEWIMKFSYEID